MSKVNSQPLKKHQYMLWKDKSGNNVQDLLDERKKLINRVLVSLGLIAFTIIFLFFGSTGIDLYGFNPFHNMGTQIGLGFTYLFLGLGVLCWAIFENFKNFFKKREHWWMFVFYVLPAITVAYAPTLMYWLCYTGLCYLPGGVLARNFGWIELVGILIGAFLLYVLQASVLRNISLMSLIAHYLIYIIVSFFFMFFNLILLLHSWTALFLFWIPAIFHDSFGYLIGRKFGKHKINEEISPNKSWEGFIAGVFAAIIMVLVIGAFYLLDKDANAINYLRINHKIYQEVIPFNNILGNMFGATPVGNTGYRLTDVYFTAIFFYGILSGLLAAAGDLLFSQFKRMLEIKDFSRIFGEHGGLLDRIDSLILIIIFFGLWMTISFGISHSLYPFFPFYANLA